MLALLPPIVFALDNGLALTPPRGWRSWNALLMNVNQQAIDAQVDAITARVDGLPSLFELGYTHVGIDDGWESCINGKYHDSSGRPLINKTRFPDMAGMNARAHSKGVFMGWYHNNCGCMEAELPPNDPQQDAEATARLGFDGAKVDSCGPQLNMSLWADAFNTTGRPIMVEDCLNKGAWKKGESPLEPTWHTLHNCPSNIYR
jgi:alpha-galactosidase